MPWKNTCGTQRRSTAHLIALLSLFPFFGRCIALCVWLWFSNAQVEGGRAQALWPALEVSPPTTELVLPSEPTLSVQYSTMALMQTHARADSVAAYYATHHAVSARCLENSCLTPRCAARS